jgi:hypothetical protein
MALASSTTAAATRLVTSHSQGEAERQDEPDQPEQCTLEDSERLTEVFRPVTNVAAENETQAGRAEDDPEQDERELQTGEPKEHLRPPVVSSPSVSTIRESRDSTRRGVDRLRPERMNLRGRQTSSGSDDVHARSS